MKHKRREWMGVIGALGVVVAVAGFVGGWLGVGTTIVLTFAVWALGATLVLLFTDPPGRG